MKLLCLLGLHRWRPYKNTIQNIAYERWGRTYTMLGLCHCTRECGVPDEPRQWTEDVSTRNYDVL